MLSLDAQDAEQRYLCEPADAGTPETLYQRAWALAVLQGAMIALRTSETASGNDRQFELLAPYLSPDADAANSGYGTAAQALQTTVENVRQHIAATLHEPTEEQIDMEVTALKTALRR